LTTKLPKAELAIMGGSGFAKLVGLTNRVIIPREALIGPFGLPSGHIEIGKFRGKKVAFLCRHGDGHIFNPTYINYRANVWALKMLGIKKCYCISACGSLTNDIKLGVLTVPHQLIDKTKLRIRSFFEIAVHASMAQPFCESSRQEIITAINIAELPHIDHAKYVTIEGPSYSTQAESEDFIFRNFHIVGMTTSPEAHLLREAGICAAYITMPTDYDAGLGEHEAVTATMVAKVFGLNVKKVKKVLRHLIVNATTPPCQCHRSLDHALHSDIEKIPDNELRILEILRRLM